MKNQYKQEDQNHYLFHTGSIDTMALNNPNSKMLSKSFKIPRFSFALNQNQIFDQNALCPIYLKIDQIQPNKGLTRKDIYQGIEINEDGSLKCVDQKIIQNGQGVIKEMIMKVAESIAQGRGIVGISLPIRIFEPRSTLEKVADHWCFAPHFLKMAAVQTNAFERMKYVISFIFAGLHAGITQQKPFNPILGETLQGEYYDGTTFFIEHISHHPPICAYILYGKGFSFYGTQEFVVKHNKTFNQIEVECNGQQTIAFSDGHKINFKLPTHKMSNLVIGDMNQKFSGVMRFVDSKNNIKAVIRMNKKSKGGVFNLQNKKKYDEVEGKIYSVSPQNMKIFLKNQSQKIKRKQDDQNDLRYDDLVDQLAEIKGNWREILYIGSEEVWNIDTFQPVRHQLIMNPLPSLIQQIQDLEKIQFGQNMVIQNKQMFNSEIWKIQLEQRQREEKKLREHFKKNNNN